MEVRLVDVAALRRHEGGAVTRSKTMGRVVKTNQLGGAFGCDADLGPEPRPEALPAPSDLGGQPLDPNLPPTGDHLCPREGDFRVDLPTCLVSST